VTPVLIGLLLSIGLALAVIGVVAYPHLREGAPLLTPEGERLAREARQKAQSLAGGAADALTNRDRPAGEQTIGGTAVSGPAGSPPARPGATPAGPGAPGQARSSPGSGSGSAAPRPSGGGGPAPSDGARPVGQSADGTDRPSGPQQVPPRGPVGQAAGDPLPRLTDARVVWASPPPQLRPGGATPAPGATPTRPAAAPAAAAPAAAAPAAGPQPGGRPTPASGPKQPGR
jgi:hypothetical protein